MLLLFFMSSWQALVTSQLQKSRLLLLLLLYLGTFVCNSCETTKKRPTSCADHLLIRFLATVGPTKTADTVDSKLDALKTKLQEQFDGLKAEIESGLIASKREMNARIENLEDLLRAMLQQHRSNLE